MNASVSMLFEVPKVFATNASPVVEKPEKTAVVPGAGPEYGIFGDARSGRWSSFSWPTEYKDWDIELPRDCKLKVARLG